MATLTNIFKTASVIKVRAKIARFRAKYDLFYRLKRLEDRQNTFLANFYNEVEPGFLKVMGILESLRYVKDRRCSICRFGDGELALMAGKGMLFENANVKLQKCLKNVLESPLDNCLCCLPDCYGSLSWMRPEIIEFWRSVALWSRSVISSCLEKQYFGDSGVVIGNAFVSRCYFDVVDKSIAPLAYDLWKEIFAGEQLLVVEGRYSRIGVGNDLLSGAKSIRRIWCPPVGAFSHYDQIKEAILRNMNQGEVVVLAIGATATVLAHDLSCEGIRALDVGHVDIEYVWMKMGTKQKVPIKGRYVVECLDGRETLDVVGEEQVLNVVAKVGVV